MTKKILMAICFIIITTLMVSATGMGKITVETATIEQGETTATVKIDISENPGIVFATFLVEFPNELTITAVTDGAILGKEMHTDNMTSPYQLTWHNGEAKTDYTANGTAATLGFKVPADIAPGTYPITLTVVQEDTFNFNDEDVNFNVTNGALVVNAANKAEVSGEMLGAQLRTTGVPGLRFATKINVNDKFMTSLTGGNTYDTLGAVFADGVSNVSFGTLAVPLFVLEDNSLKAENLTHALAGDIDIADVICQNIYDYDASSFSYTAVITNIPTVFSGGKIVARGYVKYTENGKTLYHYFDPVCVAPSGATAEGWTK